MRKFDFELNTKIYFGTHILKEALEAEADKLSGDIMIVTTGRSLIKYGYVDELKEVLENITVSQKVIVFHSVSQNPRLEEVEAAVQIGKEQKIQCVIGFGGGSALDAAKAVAVGIAAEEGIEEYFLNKKEPPETTLPVIAIPTTAGTGSELSKGAILTSIRHHKKDGIRGKYILPVLAIVDAAYTQTVPMKITMETGFDVLAHAIESYVAVKATPFSEMLSEKAINLVSTNLRLLKQNLQNPEAREAMCFSSMIMGMNLANVGTCLPHRIQYAVGVETDTSHGAGLLALYPAWLANEFEESREKIVEVMEWMGFPSVKNALDVKESFQVFLNELELSYSLSGLGIEKGMLPVLADAVTGNLANDPLAKRAGVVEMLLEQAM